MNSRYKRTGTWSRGGGGTGWGGAPRVWASLPSYLALLPRRARLLRSAAVELEGLAPALPVYSELLASGSHLLTRVEWLCVFVPLEEVREIYVARCTRSWCVQLHAVGLASRPVLALRPNSGRLTTSRLQVPGPHRRSKRHSLSCTPRGQRIYFPDEDFLPQGVLQYSTTPSFFLVSSRVFSISRLRQASEATLS